MNGTIRQSGKTTIAQTNTKASLFAQVINMRAAPKTAEGIVEAELGYSRVRRKSSYQIEPVTGHSPAQKARW